MALIRPIGRWALTGLMINCTIGGGIFGVPGELARWLGVASPLAMIAGGITVAVIIACAAEVASQFPEPGGSYVYVRRAFGRFAGLQAAWFYWLTVAGGAAAIANVFASYLGGMIPALAGGWARAITAAVLIAVPTVINCLRTFREHSCRGNRIGQGMAVQSGIAPHVMRAWEVSAGCGCSLSG